MTYLSVLILPNLQFGQNYSFFIIIVRWISLYINEIKFNEWCLTSLRFKFWDLVIMLTCGYSLVNFHIFWFIAIKGFVALPITTETQRTLFFIITIFTCMIITSVVITARIRLFTFRFRLNFIFLFSAKQGLRSIFATIS